MIAECRPRCRPGPAALMCQWPMAGGLMGKKSVRLTMRDASTRLSETDKHRTHPTGDTPKLPCPCSCASCVLGRHRPTAPPRIFFSPLVLFWLRLIGDCKLHSRGDLTSLPQGLRPGVDVWTWGCVGSSRSRKRNPPPKKEHVETGAAQKSADGDAQTDGDGTRLGLLLSDCHGWSGCFCCRCCCCCCYYYCCCCLRGTVGHRCVNRRFRLGSCVSVELYVLVLGPMPCVSVSLVVLSESVCLCLCGVSSLASFSCSTRPSVLVCSTDCVCVFEGQVG